jgi:transposase
MRFIAPLDASTQAQLKHLMKTHPVFQVRQRAHAILLSAKGYRIEQLVDIFDADRDTITAWIDRFERGGPDALENKARPGRPRRIPPEAEPDILTIIAAHPQQLKRVIARLQSRFDVSLDTVKRLLRRHAYGWRRARRSLRSQRDEAAFRAAQAELKALQKQEDRGEIDLVYFDEVGFSLLPVVPYAWQAPGQRIALQTGSHHRRLNVVGFLRRNQALTPFVAEGSVCKETVLACIDAFAETITKETVLVLDNASIHTAGVIEQARPRWQEKGLRLFYLPSYAPELNLIERLWQEIKYRWLPFSAYESWDHLKEAVEEVLLGVGEKYRITFA